MRLHERCKKRSTRPSAKLRNGSPENTHILISGSCAYHLRELETSLLQMRLRTLGRGDKQGFSGWVLNAITCILIRKMRKIWHRRRWCEDGAGRELICWPGRLEWYRHKPRNVGIPEVEKGKNRLFPRGFRGSTALLMPWGQPNGTTSKLLASRTVRRKKFFFFVFCLRCPGCGNLLWQPQETHLDPHSNFLPRETLAIIW